MNADNNKNKFISHREHRGYREKRNLMKTTPIPTFPLRGKGTTLKSGLEFLPSPSGGGLGWGWF
jgi:hypothetical protein